MAKTAPVSVAGRGHQDPFLQDLKFLSSRAYLYRPSAARSQPERQQLIILCTWMGATSRHLAKYVTEYIKRYPDTPLILITSPVKEVFLGRSSSQIGKLSAAVTFVKGMQDKANATDTQLEVLLHVMSNGGTSAACRLSEVYEVLYPRTSDATKQPNHTQLPVSAMIIDSAPSLPHIKLSHDAMMSTIPKDILTRMVAGTLFWIGILAIYVIDKVTGRPSFFHKMRSRMNDVNGPFLSKDTPRTYICGKNDKMVPMEDVLLHASDAIQALGTPETNNLILVEEFKGSGHVMHMPSEPERYWDIVQRTWSRATT